MQPTQFLRPKILLTPHVSVVPALRKLREGQGTRCVGDASGDQNPGPLGQKIHGQRWALDY
jgi:hypothetical protein